MSFTESCRRLSGQGYNLTHFQPDSTLCRVDSIYMYLVPRASLAAAAAAAALRFPCFYRDIFGIRLASGLL